MSTLINNLLNKTKRVWEREVACKVKACHILVPLGLATLAFMLVFWRLGEGSLYNWDEATYADLATEILGTNDWFTLHRNGEFFFEKPPLYIWLTALAYKVFGVNEFAARFWSALSGVGVVVGTYFLGSRLFDRRVGLMAGVLLLGINNLSYSHGYNFLSIARTGQMDMPLTLTILLTMFFGWRGLKQPKYFFWMGATLGIGLMIKSLVALLPFGVIVLEVLLTQGFRGLKRWQLWGGLMLALAIALPWHLGQVLVHGQDFLDVYVGKHLLGRSLTTLDVSYHQGGLTYYLDIIYRGFPIWSWVMIPALGYGIWRVCKLRDQSLLLVLSWVLIPLILFTVAQTKIGWYCVVIYPALTLMLAVFFRATLGRRWAVLAVLVVWLVFNPRLPSTRDGSSRHKIVAGAIPHWTREGDVVLSYNKDIDYPMPADLFYADAHVTAISGGDDELLDLLKQLQGNCAYVLTLTHTWHDELPGEIVRQAGEHLLVRVCPGSD